MLASRLSSAASVLSKINRPTCLVLQRNLKKQSMDDDFDDKPVRYSQSNASRWKAEYTRMPPNERVWYTPYVVSGSVAIFLIYFCILREENDIDELIYRPLPYTLEGIEKVYPEFDFENKPDFVVYHEEKKRLKELKKKKASESSE